MWRGWLLDSPAPQDQLWIKLRGWEAVDSCLMIGQLSFQIAQLNTQATDTSLQLLSAAFMPGGSSLSAGVGGSELIDVAVVFVHDQLIQILVIEALALAGAHTGDFVVVQIDLNRVTSRVEQIVKVFGLARFFHNCFDLSLLWLDCLIVRILYAG